MSYWLWFTLACVFVIVEIASPTFYFLWLAIAAFAVGGLKLFMPQMDFVAQLALFAVMTAAAFFSWRSYLKKNPLKSKDPLLNSRARQMIGKNGIVVEAIQHGHGRVKVGDSTWMASGNNIPVNTAVKIVAANGQVLEVKKAG